MQNNESNSSKSNAPASQAQVAPKATPKAPAQEPVKTPQPPQKTEAVTKEQPAKTQQQTPPQPRKPETAPPKAPAQETKTPAQEPAKTPQPPQKTETIKPETPEPGTTADTDKKVSETPADTSDIGEPAATKEATVAKQATQISLKKNEKTGDTGVAQSVRHGEANWLFDRYQSAIIQRNLMVLLNILALISVVVSTITATEITKHKSLDPFVIEIDKKTGIVTLVDQDKVKLFTPDQAVNNFFIIQYIRNRELFDPRNYKYNYYKIVRLMSNETTFRSFMRILRLDNPQNPMTAYANNVGCSLSIRSIHYLQPDTVQIRFTVIAEYANGSTISKNKIVIISFAYPPVTLSEEDRYINPLGFTVISYNISDEVV